MDSRRSTSLRRQWEAPPSWWLAIVLAVGSVLLHQALTVDPSSKAFYGWSAALALTWLAARPGRSGVDAWPLRRAVAAGLAAGVGLGLACWAGAWVMGRLPVVGEPISSYVESVLAQSEDRPWLLVLVVAVLTGVTEEVCFRGGLFSVVEARIGAPRPALQATVITTVIYAVVTLATGNLLLVLAAAVLGATAGGIRAVTGRLPAAIAVHAAWTITMLLTLPSLSGSTL